MNTRLPHSRVAFADNDSPMFGRKLIVPSRSDAKPPGQTSSQRVIKDMYKTENEISLNDIASQLRDIRESPHQEPNQFLRPGKTLNPEQFHIGGLAERAQSKQSPRRHGTLK